MALSEERVEFLVDMMRDINVYVESKDFELGLPITNFARYHELWSMQYPGEEWRMDTETLTGSGQETGFP